MNNPSFKLKMGLRNDIKMPLEDLIEKWKKEIYNALEQNKHISYKDWFKKLVEIRRELTKVLEMLEKDG